MKSTLSTTAVTRDSVCRLHSLHVCHLCYNGTYSLDLSNPVNQMVVSSFLEKTRKKNHRGDIFERINRRKEFARRIRRQSGVRSSGNAGENDVVSSDDDDSEVEVLGTLPTPVTEAPRQIRTAEPLPAPAPEQIQTAEPLPAPAPKQIQTAEPLPAPAPEQIQTEEPVPVPAPKQIRIEEPVPAPAPTRIWVRETVLTPAPKEIQAAEPVLAPAPKQIRTAQPVPKPAPKQIQSAQPVPAPVPRQIRTAEPVPAPVPKQIRLAEPVLTPASKQIRTAAPALEDPPAGNELLPITVPHPAKNQSLPGTRMAAQYLQWLSQPNSSKSSILSSRVTDVKGGIATSHEPFQLSCVASVPKAIRTAEPVPIPAPMQIRSAEAVPAPVPRQIRTAEPVPAPVPKQIRPAKPVPTPAPKQIRTAAPALKDPPARNEFLPITVPHPAKNQSLPGTRMAAQYLQWLSQPNSSKSSILSSRVTDVSGGIKTSHEPFKLSGERNPEVMLQPRRTMKCLASIQHHTSSSASPAVIGKNLMSVGTVRPSVIKINPLIPNCSPIGKPRSTSGTARHKPHASCTPLAQLRTQGKEIDWNKPICYFNFGGTFQHFVCREHYCSNRELCEMVKCYNKDCPALHDIRRSGNTAKKRGQENLRQTNLDKSKKISEWNQISRQFSAGELASTSSSTHSSNSGCKFLCCSSKDKGHNKTAPPPGTTTATNHQMRVVLGGSSLGKSLTLTSSSGDLRLQQCKQQPTDTVVQALLPAANEDNADSSKRSENQGTEVLTRMMHQTSTSLMANASPSLQTANASPSLTASAPSSLQPVNESSSLLKTSASSSSLTSNARSSPLTGNASSLLTANPQASSLTADESSSLLVPKASTPPPLSSLTANASSSSRPVNGSSSLLKINAPSSCLASNPKSSMTSNASSSLTAKAPSSSMAVNAPSSSLTVNTPNSSVTANASSSSLTANGSSSSLIANPPPSSSLTAIAPSSSLIANAPLSPPLTANASSSSLPANTSSSSSLPANTSSSSLTDNASSSLPERHTAGNRQSFSGAQPALLNIVKPQEPSAHSPTDLSPVKIPSLELLQPDQPLPPFESIGGKSHSAGIKEYWAQPSKPPEQAFPHDERPHSNESIDFPIICWDWLVNSARESLKEFRVDEEPNITLGQIVPAPGKNEDRNSPTLQNSIATARPKLMVKKNRRKCAVPKRKLPSKPKHTSSEDRVTKSQKSQSDDFIVVCQGEGFKIKSSTLERASPVFKDFADKCCTWMDIDGTEYRAFEVVGVSSWAMLQVLNFVSSNSYNHSVMRTSHMKRLLEQLEIKYKQTSTFIFLDS